MRCVRRDRPCRERDQLHRPGRLHERWTVRGHFVQLVIQPGMPDSAYTTLVASFTRLYRYQHLAAIAGWDQAAMMPEHGNEARAAALAELAVLMHETLTDPGLGA